MKTRFNTFDIVCSVAELQKYVGMRVNNVYDIDNRTYLIRLQRSEEKCILLLESGNRIHMTNFEWPKNMAPSGFSMKMRKHLKNKRLESLTQLGMDRIVALQFGSGEAAYHLILELYDKGNIVLTDFEKVILYVLRPHTEGDRMRFAVREKYPENRARDSDITSMEALKAVLESAKPGDQLKKVLISKSEYGPAVIEHVLLKREIANNVKIGSDFSVETVWAALEEAAALFEHAKTSQPEGFIVQKKEVVGTPATSENEFYFSNQEFHPLHFSQHLSLPVKRFDSFNVAVDEFFSQMESQKLELKALQQQRDAVKKLDNVRQDHDQRLVALETAQQLDRQKAELIMRNQVLVDDAIRAVQSALASQISWDDLRDLVKESASRGDPIAQHITQLKLETNHISLHLTDPYEDGEDDRLPSMMIDVDLDQSAFANGRKYYDLKRHAAKKQQKTLESQSKAFKSAEKKTKQTLKDVQTITNINKARKVFWFEKFFWFISSENYLVIAGRDQQQNELIVKRYMKPNDVYVHADVHGASSVIIKNPSTSPVPPKTLNEAGTMAICYSVAWEAKVVTNSYWVWGEQVTKTAPTGEYLTTGSFMIRGKKNFLPQSLLVLGFSFLFKLEDGSVERHKDDRRVLGGTEDADVITQHDQLLDDDDDVEAVIKVTSDSSSEDDAPKFPDTHIQVQHTEGTRVKIITQSSVTSQGDDNDDDLKVVYLGDDQPVVLKPIQKSRGNAKIPSRQDVVLPAVDGKEGGSGLKRGQKSKLKKIKEKYGDQDEEERKMRMDILQSAGSVKEPKKSKNKNSLSKAQLKRIEPKKIAPVVPPQKPQQQDGDGVDDEEPVVQAELDMINTLTGVPTAEDELLFAVPVVAPYTTLSNYKFKVKLTPGTGRRGKAARTAVAMFLKDRAITPREKDVIKAVKDEQLARNLPGKVKLSAPKLQNLKHR